MSKTLKILIISIVLIIIFATVAIFISVSYQLEKDRNTVKDSHVLVRIHDGEKIYHTELVGVGEQFIIPASLKYLTDNNGNKYKGLTLDYKNLLDSENIKVTKDTDLYIVFARSVQVIFTITNGFSTISTTTFSMFVGETISANIPILEDGKVWTIQWTESGLNTGLDLTNDEILKFVVVEPIIFNCSQ